MVVIYGDFEIACPMPLSSRAYHLTWLSDRRGIHAVSVLRGYPVCPTYAAREHRYSDCDRSVHRRSFESLQETRHDKSKQRSTIRKWSVKQAAEPVSGTRWKPVWKPAIRRSSAGESAARKPAAAIRQPVGQSRRRPAR